MPRGEIALLGFFAAVGSYWIVEGSGMAYWTRFSPGPGFIPIWLGAIVLGLVALQVAAAILRPSAEGEAAPPADSRKPVWIALALAACTFALEFAGMAASVFAMLVFLLAWVERLPPARALAIAGATVASLYGVFALWLKVPLPRGPWGF